MMDPYSHKHRSQNNPWHQEFYTLESKQVNEQKLSFYDQEIPQSPTADQPTAP